MPRLRITLVFLAGFIASPARAQKVPPEVSVDSAPTNSEPSADRKLANPLSPLSWGGRVFVGNTVTRQRLAGTTYWRSRQQVRSARIGLRYKDDRGMKAVIKLEFDKGAPKLKDAYVRLAPVSGVGRGLRVVAGRFKQPMSNIGLAGRWDLPSIERGLLDSIQVEGQSLPFVGGRGDGVQVEYKPLASGVLQFTSALFQNKLGTGTASLDASDNFAQDVYLRSVFRPVRRLEIASSVAFFGYLKKTGDSSSFSHAPVVSLEMSYQPGWVRLWAEGYFGKAMFSKVDGSSSGNFLGARLLVAGNLKTGTPRRLQPYAGLSYFDPGRSERNNSNSEVLFGVNLAFAKTWRLQVEGSQTFSEGLGSSAIKGTAIRVQLGAKFKD